MQPLRANTLALRKRLITQTILGLTLFIMGVSQASAEEPRIVFLGDSLTAGFGLAVTEAYPALIEEKLRAADKHFRVVNAGVSGDTTSGGLQRVGWISKDRIDLLVLALGGNDGLRGLDPGLTKSNLGAIIDAVRSKYPKVKILLAGMLAPPNLGEQYTSAFRNAFTETAAEKHVAFLPFLLEDVAAHPELNQGDGIHPTAAGQKIVAEHVWSALQPLLAELQ